MYKSNNFEFSDKKIDALPLGEKLYSNQDWIRNGLDKGKLKIRVGKRDKTFVLYWNGKRYSLGQFSKNYGLANANSEALSIMEGKVTSIPSARAESFGSLASKIFDEKEAKGKKNTKNDRSVFFSHLPNCLINKPINHITREDVIAWKANMLKTKSCGAWNKYVAVPNNIWNIASDTYAFSLLENKRNPFSKLKEDTCKRFHPVPSLKDVRGLWKAFNDHADPMINMMFKLKVLTGMHFTEMQQLRVKDIQEDWLIMEVGVHKISNIRNGIVHKIWLHPAVRKLFKSWCDMCSLVEPQQLLFSYTGLVPIHKATFNRGWNAPLKKANLSFRCDRLRDTLVTNMRGSGFESKYITGHCYRENIQTKHYTDWDSENIKQLFLDANNYWQTKIYENVKDMWF